ncbi:MAG: hypothetical protein RLZZ375_1531 [Pseudomonadota bacterium]|jgi:hypothetical protein
MRDPTLMLPFALPPAQHAKDLINALKAPALALCLARGSQLPEQRFDAFAAALPHEILRYGCGPDNSPPLAHQHMQQLGLPSQSGYWFLLQPVHFHVARDHLVLTDLRQLPIDEATSRALFDAASPLFSELGHELQFGDAHHWFIRADSWHSLRTTTPDAATGHNVDVWLPSGEHARAWRRLHNEIQMLWHTHLVNETREAQGLPRINALWLWGGAHPDQHTSLPETLIMDESLIPHAIADDWGRWLVAMQDLEHTQVVPLLQQLRSKTIDTLTLQLTDANNVRQWRVSRLDLLKFWRAPSLATLVRAS